MRTGSLGEAARPAGTLELNRVPRGHRDVIVSIHGDTGTLFAAGNVQPRAIRASIGELLSLSLIVANAPREIHHRAKQPETFAENSPQHARHRQTRQ